jgi:hypothetical protein
MDPDGARGDQRWEPGGRRGRGAANVFWGVAPGIKSSQLAVNPASWRLSWDFAVRKFRTALTLENALSLTNGQKFCMGPHKTLTKSFPQNHFL